MWGTNLFPRMAIVVGRRQPIFFADNHLGRDARLTSVGKEGKKPHWQGMGLAIWPDDIWRHVQSERRKLRLCSKPRPLSVAVSVPSHASCGNVLFPGRYVRQIHSSAAILAIIPLAPGSI